MAPGTAAPNLRSATAPSDNSIPTEPLRQSAIRRVLGCEPVLNIVPRSSTRFISNGEFFDHVIEILLVKNHG
jgi:hypothetical protein